MTHMHKHWYFYQTDLDNLFSYVVCFKHTHTPPHIHQKKIIIKIINITTICDFHFLLKKKTNDHSVKKKRKNFENFQSQNH